VGYKESIVCPAGDNGKWVHGTCSVRAFLGTNCVRRHSSYGHTSPGGRDDHGGMAKRGLLKYGAKALGPVLEQLNNPDPFVRSAALRRGIHILRNVPASHLRIEDIIRSSLKDSDLVVRSSAVQEIVS